MAKVQYSTFTQQGRTRVSLSAEDLILNIREVENDNTFSHDQKEAINTVYNAMLNAILKESH